MRSVTMYMKYSWLCQSNQLTESFMVSKEVGNLFFYGTKLNAFDSVKYEIINTDLS